jgi:hypothetical protein
MASRIRRVLSGQRDARDVRVEPPQPPRVVTGEPVELGVRPGTPARLQRGLVTTSAETFGEERGKVHC